MSKIELFFSEYSVSILWFFDQTVEAVSMWILKSCRTEALPKKSFLPTHQSTRTYLLTQSTTIPFRKPLIHLRQIYQNHRGYWNPISHFHIPISQKSAKIGNSRWSLLKPYSALPKSIHPSRRNLPKSRTHGSLRNPILQDYSAISEESTGNARGLSNSVLHFRNSFIHLY